LITPEAQTASEFALSFSFTSALPAFFNTSSTFEMPTSLATWAKVVTSNGDSDPLDIAPSSLPLLDQDMVSLEKCGFRPKKYRNPRYLSNVFFQSDWLISIPNPHPKPPGSGLDLPRVLQGNQEPQRQHAALFHDRRCGILNQRTMYVGLDTTQTAGMRNGICQ
jgi:hypothetical protein